MLHVALTIKARRKDSNGKLKNLTARDKLNLGDRFARESGVPSKSSTCPKIIRKEISNKEHETAAVMENYKGMRPEMHRGRGASREEITEIPLKVRQSAEAGAIKKKLSPPPRSPAMRHLNPAMVKGFPTSFLLAVRYPSSAASCSAALLLVIP